MCETKISLRELALIAGTRAALGAGLALLLGNSLPPREQKVFGWALLLAGVGSTIPLAADVLTRTHTSEDRDWWEKTERAHANAG